MEVFITSYLYPTMGSQGAVVEQLQHNEENQIRLDRDMGRNEQFSKEKGFILRDTEKKYSFRDSNPRSMDLVRVNSLALSYLACRWMGINVAYIKYRILCLQIKQVYAIVTKDKLLTISNKMPCKSSSNISISYHRCDLLVRNVTRMSQEGILSVLKNNENEL